MCRIQKIRHIFHSLYLRGIDYCQKPSVFRVKYEAADTASGLLGCCAGAHGGHDFLFAQTDEVDNRTRGGAGVAA